ncbi:MAG TPA: hypothetical protein VK083_08100 [Nocardia sp.]|uniref:hypothetical protein n=1 Tax=Nocardia TaxID=1817 RepID=UPI002454451F|nr:MULTISPECIES: hypothetical protein [Nocardia]HLS76733.1 hypothetical protein [Nocardia sp.]
MSTATTGTPESTEPPETTATTPGTVPSDSAPERESTATDAKQAREHTAPTTVGARTVSVELSTALTVLVVAALLTATVTLGILYASARSTIAATEARAADERRAEQIALDYALGASTIDYRDVASWFTRLKDGAAAPLAAKFDATAPQLEQILLPLQWTSTATALSADVISESDGVFQVNAYLTVDSTSVQNPDGARTTVTYSLTIDRAANWEITEVGGLQNAIPR